MIWLVTAACTVWTWSNSGGRGKLCAIKSMSYDECGCNGRMALMGVGYVLLGRKGKGGERGSDSGRKSKFLGKIIKIIIIYLPQITGKWKGRV